MKNLNQILSAPKNILNNLYSDSKYSKLKQNLEKFPSYKFDKIKKNWIDISKENQEIISKNSLTFMSYNVWFENVNWKNRLKSLFDIFQSYSPDFICLQEVTEPFLKELINKEFIRENYCFSGNFRGGYDVLILSKFNVNFFSMAFESRMGRNLLLTEINHSFDNINYSNIIIATSHFESLNNAKLRKQQLETSFEILNNSETAFLMGDFNFDSSWKNEEVNIDKNFNDCWFNFRDKNNLNDEDRYTMPKSNHFPAWRPDRILYKNDKFLELEYFEIIGNNQIEQDEYNNVVKTPSDHYGLFAMFKLKN